MPAVADSIAIGKPYVTEVGTFVRYEIPAGRRGWLEKNAATDAARRLARVAHQRVVDVASAVRQPTGCWIVELQVKP